MYVLQVVKQRVQARVYPNMITAITEMSRTEGIGGFYTGYGIQVMIPSLQHPSSLVAIVRPDCEFDVILFK